jgi:sugar phosphate isomerase/epimerase
MYYGIRLSGDAEWDEELRGRLGELPHFLARARDLGVGFVELGTGEEPDPAALLRRASLCREAGLAVSLHPYLRQLGPEAFGEAVGPDMLRPILELADETARTAGTPAPLVFHGGLAGYEPHNKGLAQATANAKAFFIWADMEATSSLPNVRLFCETQLPSEPGEAFVRVGYTYERCLDLVEGTRVGICWDFGHAFRSAMLGHHPAVPPPEFLRRVGHVHAHDTIAHPERPSRVLDHQPLGTGFCPWREYTELLASVDYGGWVLFEIPVERFSSFEALGVMVRGSIRALDTILSPGAKQ